MVLCAALLLPFVTKPAHIDDPLFLWQARQILAHPLDPYGFAVNWNGYVHPLHEIALNPPLASYCLAGVEALFGRHEIAFHVVFLSFALLALLGTWMLARRWTEHPAIAAATLLACPAFLVSSTTLMCDVLMLACFVWALWWWVKGTDEKRTVFLLIGIALAVCATFSKYFGLSVVGLMCIYSALTVGFRWRWCATLALPVLALALYETWASARYGHVLIFHAVASAHEAGSFGGGSVFVRLVAAVTFLGGSAAGAALCMSAASGARRLAGFVGISVVVATGTWAFGGEFGRSVLQGPAHFGVVVVQILIWLVAGTTLLWSTRALWQRTSPVRVVLVAWIIGTLVFGVFVNWSIAGRTIVPLLPAVSIMAAIAFESGRVSRRALFVSLFSGMLLGVFVAVGDQDIARSERLAAEDLVGAGRRSGRAVWFQGHWGFQYYAQLLGGRAMEAEGDLPVSGDTVIVPLRNTAAWGVPREACSSSREVVMPLNAWMTTMGSRTEAGFYAHLFGILPFGLDLGEPDEYWVNTLR